MPRTPSAWRVSTEISFQPASIWPYVPPQYICGLLTCWTSQGAKSLRASLPTLSDACHLWSHRFLNLASLESTQLLQLCFQKSCAKYRPECPRLHILFTYRNIGFVCFFLRKKKNLTLLIIWRKCSGMKASKCQEQKDVVTCETDSASCLSESPTLEAGWPFLEIENSPLPSDLCSASQGCDCAWNHKEAKLQIPASRSWYQAAPIFNQRNTAKKKGIWAKTKLSWWFISLSRWQPCPSTKGNDGLTWGFQPAQLEIPLFCFAGTAASSSGSGSDGVIIIYFDTRENIVMGEKTEMYHVESTCVCVYHIIITSLPLGSTHRHKMSTDEEPLRRKKWTSTSPSPGLGLGQGWGTGAIQRHWNNCPGTHQLAISPELGSGVCLLNPGPIRGSRGERAQRQWGAHQVMKNVQAALSILLTNKLSMTSSHCGVSQSYSEL